MKHTFITLAEALDNISKQIDTNSLIPYIRYEGKPVTSVPSIYNLLYNPDKYDIAIAVLEGKPLFAGDRVYYKKVRYGCSILGIVTSIRDEIFLQENGQDIYIRGEIVTLEDVSFEKPNKELTMLNEVQELRKQIAELKLDHTNLIKAIEGEGYIVFKNIDKMHLLTSNTQSN
jgi:hypothetical protein